METCDECSGLLAEDETEICDGCRYTVAELDDDYNAGPKHPCPACCGEGVPLGTLGTWNHYRCRQCGMNFSENTETCE